MGYKNPRDLKLMTKVHRTKSKREIEPGNTPMVNLH
jgi:hypothetical protein